MVLAKVSECTYIGFNINENAREHYMNDLIAKLSKVDQRNVKLALIHASTGNMRALDSMVRAANNRSYATLMAIREAV